MLGIGGFRCEVEQLLNAIVDIIPVSVPRQSNNQGFTLPVLIEAALL